MSGLRHVLKTRTYRERSQPAARSHLGLLEKKKDYKQRAKDFHKKEDAINKLREKASLKNPDEFYFKMNNTRTEGGVHRKQAAKQPTGDDMRQFKREDAGYLMMKQTAEAKKIERLRATLHMLDAPLRNKHTVYVDDEASASAIDAAASAAATPAEIAATGPLRASSPASKLRSGEHAPPKDGDEGRRGRAPLSKKAAAKLGRARAAQYEELEQRVARHDKMGHTLQRIGIEKALWGKGPRRKIKTVTDSVVSKAFKFRQRRKK
mmetsp:Transcript_1819/g.5193  ORF Transcript_1819/g.5193 Transcript_1819/m.5193 type:complete len:264 (+) Transcript_1819:101-892(+)